MKNMMQRNTELRKLPAGSLSSIVDILNIGTAWKSVMSNVPKDPQINIHTNFEAKYTNEHITKIEEHAKATGRTCTEILFDEWGTSGRVRPTLGTLMAVVLKAQMYRAADEIAVMLGEPRPERPKTGPAALIDTTIFTSDLNTTCSTLAINNGVTTERIKSDRPNNESDLIPNFSALIVSPSEAPTLDIQDEVVLDYQTSLPNIPISDVDISTGTESNLVHFEYSVLQQITKNFSEKFIYIPESVGENYVERRLAGKVGSGGFSEVYVGYHEQYGHLAVKRARPHPKVGDNRDAILRAYKTEIKYLPKFRHKNIVSIIGFSEDGPSPCVVCEYVDGGSLEQKIARKTLTEQQRINIMNGTAEGLRYLHSNGNHLETSDSDALPYKKSHFVHGDVKSANILLTREPYYVPKLCDFGIGKQYDATADVLTRLIGTSTYMAPETFKGTVTQKSDIYSFGIVILELLTGLKSLVKINASESHNLKEHVEQIFKNNNFHLVVDQYPKWTKATEVYSLAQKCLDSEWMNRPSSAELCEILSDMSSEILSNSKNDKDT